MPSFTPSTYRMPYAPEPRSLRLGVVGMFRRLPGIPTGYAVLITSGVATPTPGLTTVTTDQEAAADAGSGDAGKAYFTAGRTYTVTAAEKTILEAAGYTVDV